jgi:hypothetical protein
MGKTGAEGVSVGGTGVFVGVLVGSGVLVAVGKLVAVGVGVSVGGGANVLQDANVIARTESRIALPVVFIFPHFCFAVLTNIQRFVALGRGRRSRPIRKMLIMLDHN